MPVLHVEVFGRVQGVGFRWFVRQIAQRRGLSGWVMNRRDGCVEVAARGSLADLEILRTEIRSGPPGSAVSEVRDLAAIAESEIGDSFRTR